MAFAATREQPGNECDSSVTVKGAIPCGSVRFRSMLRSMTDEGAEGCEPGGAKAGPKGRKADYPIYRFQWL